MKFFVYNIQTINNFKLMLKQMSFTPINNGLLSDVIWFPQIYTGQ